MERQVIFRDYQEQTASDHTGLQEFVQESLDHIVKDGLSASRRFAEFQVSKTNQIEVTIAPGRVYDTGEVFARRSNLVQSLASYTAAAAKRIVAITAYGVETETDVTTRDFLIDTNTGETEPKAVALTRSRDVQIVFTPGGEAVDPVAPPVPATHVLIALVLVDATQILSITMNEEARLVSTDVLDERTDDLEEFRAQIEPQVSSLASDLAALANLINQLGHHNNIEQLFYDMARVKESLDFPDTAAAYGADRFLTPAESDTTNISLGYDALVEEGVRFAHANENVSPLALFSPSDENASVVNGILLPKYDNVRKLYTGPYTSSLGMAQYNYQTYNLVQKMMSRERIRYGEYFEVCTNNSWWKNGQYDPVTQIFKKNGETFQVVLKDGRNPGHIWYRVRQIFTDYYQEPYWEYVVSNQTINGAMIAQTFLIANDMWATRIGFHIQSKAATENIHVAVCEVVNGQPDLSKVVMYQVYPHASIVTGMNYIDITPTFLKSGSRYALCLTSQANHQVGMTNGANYTNGTFFQGTDGAWLQGNLTIDLCMEVWGAKFRKNQVTMEFQALNLDGGIRAIDVLASMVVPQSTQFVYEIQPQGSGAWIALTADDTSALVSNPALCRFRGRWIGTGDVHAGITLTGSEVRIFRPKTSFKWISIARTCPSTTTIKAKLLYDGYDTTPGTHSITFTMRSNSIDEVADVIGPRVLIDATTGRYEQEFTFNVPATATFRPQIAGTTNHAGNTFHISEMVYWTA